MELQRHQSLRPAVPVVMAVVHQCVVVACTVAGAVVVDHPAEAVADSRVGAAGKFFFCDLTINALFD